MRKGEVITSLMTEPSSFYQKNTRNTETDVSKLIWAMRRKESINELLEKSLNILKKTEGNEEFIHALEENLDKRKAAE